MIKLRLIMFSTCLFLPVYWYPRISLDRTKPPFPYYLKSSDLSQWTFLPQFWLSTSRSSFPPTLLPLSLTPHKVHLLSFTHRNSPVKRNRIAYIDTRLLLLLRKKKFNNPIEFLYNWVIYVLCSSVIIF